MPSRQREISSRLRSGFFYGCSMSIHKSIAQVFENNMGNRITPELAGGMIRSLIDILAADIQQRAENAELEAVAQAAGQQQGGENGVV